jgi:CrcB protein
MITPIGLALAAAAGAVVRFRLAGIGWRGTLAVNLAGSFLLGWLLAWRGGSDLATVLGTGFCGALTTFGTFALEASAGPVRQRTVIVIANVAGCLLAAVIGHALG